ncbi:MAG: hypothetical protein BGO34_02235 [Bacteroidia bacterium 44-10]|mgnify:CR=1 FL=1|nr:MAG: hypothetical protein BGO34_02235 [Bacteroidia bacterium 44-10]
MIAKNIKGKSFKGCVRYVMNDTAQLLEAEGVLAGTTEDIIRSFAMQRSGRREVKQPVGHIPISFAPEDKERMTNDFMVQLAKEYMEEMGIRNTQYIIVRHHNTGNEHLHIVYNRINNDLKLISVNHDYKRNIKVCKKLKDKHGLTYGKGKERVKRAKLKNPDKVKYHIYDTIKAVLPQCKDEKELQSLLLKSGIHTEFKLKRTTEEVEGLSFRYGDFTFKGSQVDRKFSYGNLKKVFQKNQSEEKKQVSQIEKNRVIWGAEITPSQETILRNGGWIYLENMDRNNGEGKFSSYVFLNDEKSKLFFSKEHPDTFVSYGKYEMRLRDKILVENNQVVKAKVKWYGLGSYAYPYLWKANKSDSQYQESWDDPRIKKVENRENIKRLVLKKQEKTGRGI